MGPTQECSQCETARLLTEFAKDARLKSGRRAVCKPCDRAALAKRRGGLKPKALVLVPTFPTAPPLDPPGAGEPTAAAPPGGTALGSTLRPGETMTTVGRARPAPPASYAESAERVIDALVPPAGPADALLVRSLRGLAEMLDWSETGESDDCVKSTTALLTKLIAVQRELASTRAAKSAAVPAPAKSLGLAAY